MNIMIYILLAIAGYLSGSIPTGYLVVKWRKNIDIRTVGSGNIGATNVYRVLGIKWAIGVFIFDMLKGALPVILFKNHSSPPLIYLLSLTPFIGHCYTLWLGFKGGKGVATSAGILIIIAPISLAISLIVWLSTILLFHISSLGSLFAAVTLPVVTYFLYNAQLFFFTIALSLWVILRHRENIERLINKSEKTEKI